MKPNSIIKYSKEEYDSKEKEYQFSNNESIYCDTNKKNHNEESFNSNDSIYYDYKIKNDFDSETKYHHFTKNPK